VKKYYNGRSPSDSNEQHAFTLCLIIEGAFENVSQFLLPINLIYNGAPFTTKVFVLTSKRVVFGEAGLRLRPRTKRVWYDCTISANYYYMNLLYYCILSLNYYLKLESSQPKLETELSQKVLSNISDRLKQLKTYL
jgi:hypothetical protein